jgi:hypothetical protein
MTSLAEARAARVILETVHGVAMIARAHLERFRDEPLPLVAAHHLRKVEELLAKIEIETAGPGRAPAPQEEMHNG